MVKEQAASLTHLKYVGVKHNILQKWEVSVIKNEKRPFGPFWNYFGY